MSVLEGPAYRDIRKALGENLLMKHLLWRDHTVRDLFGQGDAQLVADHVTHSDGSPTLSFMCAANERFRQLEEANQLHAFRGGLHIGAVAEVILAERKRARQAIAELIGTDDDAVVTEAIHRLRSDENSLNVVKELRARAKAAGPAPSGDRGADVRAAY
jgi:hypothetical protein